MYFNWLDVAIGKGLFLFFLAIMTCEINEWYMIMIGIIVAIAGFINIIIGCQQDSRPVPSPYDDEFAIGSKK